MPCSFESTSQAVSPKHSGKTSTNWGGVNFEGDFEK
jgi:hypothetical protein